MGVCQHVLNTFEVRLKSSGTFSISWSQRGQEWAETSVIGTFDMKKLIVFSDILCLTCSTAWLPFPWGDRKAQSLLKVPGALSGLFRSLSLTGHRAEKSQHGPGWWHCGIRVTPIYAVNICPLLLFAEEHEGIQGPEGGRDAVAFGDGSPHGCVSCLRVEFPVSRVFCLVVFFYDCFDANLYFLS